MFFRSLKASLYVIFFAILIQFAMMAVDLYFNQRYRQLEDHHLEFARNEYNFINTLVLEKDSEHRNSSQVQLLKRYEEMILLNDSKQLKLDNSILRYRIRIASGLFGLWEQRQKLYTSLNETLPELAQSVSYIHGHHIAYLKNLIRRGVLEQDYDVGGTFKRNASQPGSELDIVSVAIDIQNSMLEIMEIFSRVQRGFSLRTSRMTSAGLSVSSTGLPTSLRIILSMPRMVYWSRSCCLTGRLLSQVSRN